jgi:AcrR family transcriptional regulator
VATAQRKPAERKTRTRLEVDARKSQLLALGIRVFSERSYDEVSIDDLAKAAGISKGLLYHYFPTKRDFYVAALSEAAASLLAQTLTADSAPPEERVRLGLETYFDFVEQHEAAYLALMRGGIGSDPEVFGILERTRATFVERILAEIPAPASPLLHAMMRGWIGFVEATSAEWLARRDVTREELVPRIGAVLAQCVALGAASAAPPVRAARVRGRKS